jgi:hypothetical protein
MFAQLQLAGETHGDDERLGVVDLDVEAEWRLEPGREGLDALGLCQRADAGQQGLEPILILGDGAGPLACHEFGQRTGTDWRPEAEVQKLGEAALGWGALILLHLDVPHLCASLQVVGRHPDLFFGCNPLLVEVGTHSG